MATYTGLDQIKRILRSLSGEKVRFSDSVTEVRVIDAQNKSNLNIAFNYNQLITSPSYSGNRILQLIFEDGENFKAYDLDPKIKRQLLLSSGDVNNDYTTPDGMFTVPSTIWGGTPVAGDRVEISFSAHLSDENGNEYIEDAEVMIDMMLSSNGIHFLPLDQDGNLISNRIFTQANVPEAVKVATSYLASYLIYTNIFAEMYQDKDVAQTSFLNRWERTSEKLMRKYIEEKGMRAPRVLAFPWNIDKIGDTTEGPGLSGRTTNFAEINRDAQTDELFGKVDE
jgi:hypothetical protein